MRKILKYFLIVVITPVLLVPVLLIIYAGITYYNPDEHTMLYQSTKYDILNHSDTLSIMTWNLGYAGLGDDMDFFYDGGSQVRTGHERTLENLRNILDFIKLHSDSDIFLFQEADKASRRSYYINMPISIQNQMPDAHVVFGKNYDVGFVPVPWYAPMGKVVSGLLTAGRYVPMQAMRVGYPGNYPLPGRLFNLQRCLIISRYALDNGNELVVINTHNSAFDDGGLRTLQMDFLKAILTDEYQKGNYVIAGGDFNQCPPGFEPSFAYNLFDDQDVMYIPDDFLPGWHFVYDAKVPTNRRMIAPYDPKKTKTTLIDFFIASPNIEPKEVNGIHLDFKYSDHNPVVVRFVLD